MPICIPTSFVTVMKNGGMPRKGENMDTGIFGRYDDALRSKTVLDNPNGPTKSLAIRYTENPPATFDGVRVVQKLFDAMADDGWARYKNKGKNWDWRDNEEVRIPKLGSEVRLERMVAASRDEQQKEWTWQMSTSSGIEEREPGDKRNAANKRRSIDLVRKNGKGSFSFVELKVGADNPLYALFEILGYALAYLHARNEGQQGSDTCNVMQAKRIQLVVLGPASWYEYKRRNDPSPRPFDLKWMGAELTRGLSDLPMPKPEFSIAFEQFDYHESLDEAAADIIRRAKEWPKK